MPLRVVSSPTESACPGCSRRDLLQGVALTATALLVGCAADNGSDGPEGGGGGGGGLATSMCNGNLCLDLNDPANQALDAVDGSATALTAGDKIKLIRTSMTTIAAVSQVCTHAGCDVAYDKASKTLKCPCHGSQFSLSGAVLHDPATRPLKTYSVQLDATTNQLTVMLK